jgi:hypothetical protein
MMKAARELKRPELPATTDCGDILGLTNPSCKEQIEFAVSSGRSEA